MRWWILPQRKWLSCSTVTSGRDGQKLTDGDTNTCVNIQSRTGVILKYEINVNKDCSHDNHVFINATVVMATDCYDLESVFVTEKPESSCSNGGMIVHKCIMIEFVVQGDNRVCSLRCKCAESVNSCAIQVYSNVKPINIQICEISVSNWWKFVSFNGCKLWTV